MTWKRSFLFVILLVAALLWGQVAFAQGEVTPIPDVTVIPSDPTAGTPVVIVRETDNTPYWFGLSAAILIAIAGGGGVLLVIDRITRSKEAKDNTEKLYLSLSPEWQSTIHRILDVAENVSNAAQGILEFARDATDGLPNVDTPPVDRASPPNSTSTSWSPPQTGPGL